MPSSFGALGVGVAGRDECEHTAHRESAVQQSDFSLHLSACCATCASVVVIHLVLYRRNVPCHFHGGFPRRFSAGDAGRVVEGRAHGTAELTTWFFGIR
jgi:hypothetical protein